MDHAACFRMQVDAIGAIRERLHAVAQFPFFRVIHFVDKGIAKAAHFYRLNVADVKVGMQGGSGFKLAVGFKFDFAGFTQLETGIQGEIMRPKRAGFIVRLQFKSQHCAVVIFVVCFQRPLLVTRKTVSRQTLLRSRAKPRPADRYAAADCCPFFE